MAHTRIAVSESSTSPVAEAWREFPATEQLTYMDVAARGVISRAVRAALDTHLDARMLGSAEKDEYFALVERTRVVTVSTVTFGRWPNGGCPVWADACHERGVFFMVGACAIVSGVSALTWRPRRFTGWRLHRVEGLLGLSTQKASSIVADAWADQMQPAYLARFSVDVGDAHEAALGSDDYTLMPAARRFDLGNYNFLGCAAADASMAQLLAYDMQAIEGHVLDLSHQLAQGFLDLGLPVCGGAPGAHLAHIVAVGEMGSSHYGTEDEPSNRSTRFSTTRTSVYRSAVASCAFHARLQHGQGRRTRVGAGQQWLRG
jgi:cysteine desulfurase/selenocysteine lyase